MALAGITRPAGAWAIELLTATDKKLFSEAVYPTLANEVLNKAAFKATNKVEAVAGNVAYSTAIITVLA